MSPRNAPRPAACLVTCEHGGSRVPARYLPLFAGADEPLASHRGWDAGALTLAREIARRLRAPLRAATVTRLLVDLNRSPHNPRLFSEWTRRLPRDERMELLRAHHTPHRAAVESAVAACVAEGGRVVHLGVHTFTPALNDLVRRADLSLLYDPARPGERALCAAWTAALRERLPHRVVRRNDPYRGVADGLTTWLRRRYPDSRYLGVEIEVNQRLLDARGRFPREVAEALVEGFKESL
ncbi:MAG: N-formylglutamate amidohydrolase [Longimicrobiales bacterium]|nr:N-formylglutamate amidohydrolase [Longimicrobiales bacterium]